MQLSSWVRASQTKPIFFLLALSEDGRLEQMRISCKKAEPGVRRPDADDDVRVEHAKDWRLEDSVTLTSHLSPLTSHLSPLTLTLTRYGDPSSASYWQLPDEQKVTSYDFFDTFLDVDHVKKAFLLTDGLTYFR